MRRRRWSIARLMAAIATLAVSLSVLQVLRPRRGMTGPGLITLILVLTLVLTAAADRALFGRRYRAFWLGFTAAGWLSAAWVLTYHQEASRYLLRYGPPLVRARDDHRIATTWALHRRVPPPPREPEWYLRASLIAEWGLGLAMGTLAAMAGGLFAVSVVLIARQASRLAQRLNLPDPVLHGPLPVVPPERSDP
jgi:hypothetical protein